MMPSSRSYGRGGVEGTAGRGGGWHDCNSQGLAVILVWTPPSCVPELAWGFGGVAAHPARGNVGVLHAVFVNTAHNVSDRSESQEGQGAAGFQERGVGGGGVAGAGE